MTEPVSKGKNPLLKKSKIISDNSNFLRMWVGHPLLTGAVAPSGKRLARKMASYVSLDSEAPVIELGPGTGPVTEALIERGIPESSLILVEYSGDFCKMLKARFPQATIVQGDAYTLPETLKDILYKPARATVSSLPLMTKSSSIRSALLKEAQNLMEQDAPFIQFTYALVPPIEPQPEFYTANASKRIWKNVPPARVWVYRKKNG